MSSLLSSHVSRRNFPKHSECFGRTLVVKIWQRTELLKTHIRGVATGGCLGEPNTPTLTKYPLRHPQVSWDFNISTMVPALPNLAMALSYASLSVAGPRAQILVATPLTHMVRYYRQETPLLLYLTYARVF